MVSPVKICITSGKGGVGKTSVAVNLSFALAEKGHRVLVVDGDLGLANVDVLLGLEVQTSIRDVLQGGGDLLDPVVYVEPNLGILPASSGVPELVNLGPDEQSQLGNILTSVMEFFDFVIMDTAAGIGQSVLWFNNFAQHSMVVLTPDPTSMTDAYALIKVLARDYRLNHFHLILNLISSEQEARHTFETMSRVARQFLKINTQYLGTIPQDGAVVKAIREQAPFVKQSPKSKAAQAVFALADRILQLRKE